MYSLAVISVVLLLLCFFLRCGIAAEYPCSSLSYLLHFFLLLLLVSLFPPFVYVISRLCLSICLFLRYELSSAVSIAFGLEVRRVLLFSPSFFCQASVTLRVSLPIRPLPSIFWFFFVWPTLHFAVVVFRPSKTSQFSFFFLGPDESQRSRRSPRPGRLLLCG